MTLCTRSITSQLLLKTLTANTMKNYWIHSGFYTFLQRFSTLIFGFGGFYLLIRMQSKQDFGVWALVITITALLEVARNGLIQNGLIKFSLGASPQEQPAIQTAALTLNILLTIASCIFLLVSGPFFEKAWNAPGVSTVFNIYCLTAIALIPFQQFSYLQQSRFDFKSLSIMYFIRQGSFFSVIFIYYILFHHISIESLAWWLLMSSVFSSIGGYFMVKKYLFISQWPTLFWVKKLFHYGKFSFGTNVSGMLFSSVDQMMLGAMIGTSQVAIYNASSKINNLIEVPISTIASIVFPQTSLKAGGNDHDGVRHMYEKSVAVLLAMILPVIIIASIIPSYILTLIAGASYAEYSGILIVILLFTLFQPFTRQFGTIMDSLGKPDINFYCIAISAGINLGLNFILIPLMGMYGAAISTLIALVIATVINLYLLKKLIGVSFWRIIQGIFPVYRFFYTKTISTLRLFLAKPLVL
jgi:lipopolysaccharide exporter